MHEGETWESQGSLRTGSRPSVTQAGEGLDYNHVSLDTVGDVGESGESPDGVAPVCHPSGGGA